MKGPPSPISQLASLMSIFRTSNGFPGRNITLNITKYRPFHYIYFIAGEDLLFQIPLLYSAIVERNCYANFNSTRMISLTQWPYYEFIH